MRHGLVAGPTLNKALAEQVMGWKLENGAQGDVWASAHAGSIPFRRAASTWNPSESLDSAWELVGSLSRRGYSVGIAANPGTEVVAMVGEPDAPLVQEAKDLDFPAATPALAICEAVVHLLGVRV